MITAKIIADSISENGNRLTTVQLCYPRFVHSEFMTHRVFSRNASSSRAIPVKRMLEMVRTEPAKPIHWGQNQPGMQADAELEQPQKTRVQSLWQEAAEAAAAIAEKMEAEGAHKQIVNRILEPFQHIHVVVTATEWRNFFDLRCHKDAQPEIQALAMKMRCAMIESIPMYTPFGGLHLPYVCEAERKQHPQELLVKLSAARCARVSYLTHDGAKPNVEADVKLYERLVHANPPHMSPVEHQATCVPSDKFFGNFKGWRQHRFDLERNT